MDIVSTASELAGRVETIEEAYEFMLAYAAQGREQEDDERDPGIRTFLERMERAASDLQQLIPTVLAGAGDFAGIVGADIAKVRAILRFVLTRPVITSQLIDNLNANMHLRTLLTDLFLISETAP